MEKVTATVDVDVQALVQESMNKMNLSQIKGLVTTQLRASLKEKVQQVVMNDPKIQADLEQVAADAVKQLMQKDRAGLVDRVATAISDTIENSRYY